MDRDDRFNTTFNPRAAVVFEPSNVFTTKLLYGRAYLAPSPQNIYDRFGTFNTDDGGLTYSSFFFQLPNVELEPQTVNTIELDMDYFVSENLSLTFSSFYSDVQNLINPVSSVSYPERINDLYPNNEYELGGVTYPIDEIVINDNLGESKIYGGTIGINYRASLGTSNIETYMNYCFMDGTIDIDEEGPIVSRNLPGISPHIVRVGGTIRSDKFSFNCRLNLYSNQRTINTNALQLPENPSDRDFSTASNIRKSTATTS